MNIRIMYTEHGLALCTQSMGHLYGPVPILCMLEAKLYQAGSSDLNWQNGIIQMVLRKKLVLD